MCGCRGWHVWLQAGHVWLQAGHVWLQAGRVWLQAGLREEVGHELIVVRDRGALHEHGLVRHVGQRRLDEA